MAFEGYALGFLTLSFGIVGIGLGVEKNVFVYRMAEDRYSVSIFITLNIVKIMFIKKYIILQNRKIYYLL